MNSSPRIRICFSASVVISCIRSFSALSWSAAAVFADEFAPGSAWFGNDGEANGGWVVNMMGSVLKTEASSLGDDWGECSGLSSVDTAFLSSGD